MLLGYWRLNLGHFDFYEMRRVWMMEISTELDTVMNESICSDKRFFTNSASEVDPARLFIRNQYEIIPTCCYVQLFKLIFFLFGSRRLSIIMKAINLATWRHLILILFDLTMSHLSFCTIYWIVFCNFRTN